MIENAETAKSSNIVNYFCSVHNRKLLRASVKEVARVGGKPLDPSARPDDRLMSGKNRISRRNEAGTRQAGKTGLNADREHALEIVAGVNAEGHERLGRDDALH